ncbi:neuraminidase-like domain-containing protein [Cellulomonas dongxiuzhuiae]|uniref:Tc toxin subunit A-related protein n=1 Tax=Cellulomonas dongxiuzhuiae TaxID=2819979 RepID=UPI001AAF26F5|nr:neuraminidase-like domain-containing protein [Cellulomonas dongxiuzhuiae]MBO3093578.1 hypothetical protein [Cellulomonas dongxiuzhuiae]
MALLRPGRPAERAKDGPDLWVAVLGPDDGDLLARSPVLTDSGPHIEQDLLLEDPSADGSELDRLTRFLAPRLGGMSLQALDDDQVAAVAQDPRLAAPEVMAAARAARLTDRAMELAARHGIEVGDEAAQLFAGLYAASRVEAVPAAVDPLARDDQWWAMTWAVAVRDGRVAVPAGGQDGVLGLLGRLRRAQRLEPAPPGTAASLGDLLTTLPGGLDDTGRATVAAELDADPGDLGGLRARLLDAHGWTAGTVNSVLRAVGLGEITGGHAPLVAALGRPDPDDAAAALADLAPLGRSQWAELVAAHGVPVHLDLPGDGVGPYVDRLLHDVEQRMPSAYLRARVEDGRIPVAEPAQVARFLANAQTFRLGDQPVLGRFAAAVDGDLAGIAAEAVPTVQAELLRIERLARVSPSLEVAERLLAGGWSSALQIASVDRRRFIEEVGDGIPGGAEVASAVHERAAAASATASALLLSQAPGLDRTPLLPVLPMQTDVAPVPDADPAAATLRSALAAGGQTATLELLFGSPDTCGCAGCASMYSPAAYLAELLQMLDGGQHNTAGASPLDVLLARRPDLAELELSCSNTETVLPLVDIVLELLESSLAGDSFWNTLARGTRTADGTIDDWGFDADLDAGNLPQQLRDDLADLGIDVGASADVTTMPVETGRRWRVAGNGWRLHLRGGANPARLRLTLYPQSIPAAAGDAIPRQYVQWAYEPLRYARFPWALPFDLAEAERDAWLERLRVSSRQVTDAYAGSDRCIRVDAACAVLGIGQGERRLLLEAPSDPWIDWGLDVESTIDENGYQRLWLDELRRVRTLRDRTGLDHRELLDLLDSRFVQASPGLAAPMVLTGDECDTTRMFVGDGFPGGRLTASVARRILLFVRLARRLDWTFRELDCAIRGLGRVTEPDLPVPPGNLSFEHFTEAFVVQLAGVQRLREATSLPVETVLNLFRDELDTQRYWDHTVSPPRLAPSFYERLLNEPAVTRPRAPGLELNATRDGLKAVPPGTGLPLLRLSDYADELAASLSCRRSDVVAVLPPTTTSVPQVLLGAASGPATVDGAWVELPGSGARVDWVVGRPTDATTQVRVTVQQQLPSGAAADVSTTMVARGSQDWRRVRVVLTGGERRVRVRAERVAGAGSVWFTAQVTTGSGLVEDVLDLGALSALSAHLLLARGLRIPVTDYVTLVTMSGIGPLGRPARALELLDAHRRTRQAGLTVAELDVLLRHRYRSAEEEEQADRELSALLGTIRESLRVEEASLTGTTETAVSLTGQLLLELGWPERLVDLVLSAEVLDRTFPAMHAVRLPTLPGQLLGVLPAGLRYSGATGQLEVSAPPRQAAVRMAAAAATLRASAEYAAATAEQRTALDVALDDLTARTAATSQEVAAALAPLARMAGSILPPVHTAGLRADTLPGAAMPTIPPQWRGSFWWDPVTQSLCWIGPMSAGWRDELAELGGTPAGSAYRAAVVALFQAADAYQPTATNLLVAAPGASPVPGVPTPERLLGELPAAADRCLALLTRVVPAVRERRAEAVVRGVLGEAFGVDEDQAAVLLERFRHTEDAVTRPLVARDAEQSWLLARDFLGADPAVSVGQAAFPAQLHALGRLAKLAMVAARTELTAPATAWLFGGWWPAAGLFDLTALPQRPVDGPAPAWSTWTALTTVLTDGERAPDRTELEAIRTALSAVSNPATRAATLAAVLGISDDDVVRLTSDLTVDLGTGGWTPPGMLHPELVSRLLTCAELLRRTGADAGTLDAWRRPATTVGATRARQLARAALSEQGWAAASPPVLDGLRLRRRDALVAFWLRDGRRDAEDLYGDLLVDPLTSACAMTSRVRHAIGSVQLFVHRIVLGLEPEVRTDAVDRGRWDVLRSYRVWEANRKILLYPENWIEPELRTDQTPPFRALAGTLTQADLDERTAAEALRLYIEGLADVAGMRVAGLCHEYADDGSLRTTYVFGRTSFEPKTYWYRRFTRPASVRHDDPSGSWTAWEPLGVDVEGEHLVPFMWRGRLFVAWAQLRQEARPPAQAPVAGTVEQPRKLWTMKLAWSERRNGRWTARRVHSGHPALANVLLSVDTWPEDTIFLRPVVQEQGVAISVYLNPTLYSNAAADTLSQRSLDSVPVFTFFFDGDDARPAAGYYRYRQSRLGQPPEDNIGYSAVEPAENPIAVDLTTSITPHRAMTVPRPAGQFSVPSGTGMSSVLKTAPRRLAVVMPADEPVLQLQAPSTLLPGLGGRTVPFVLADRARQLFVYPVNRLTMRSFPPPVPGSPPLISLVDEPGVHITALDMPQLGRFRQILERRGVDAALATATQYEPEAPAGVRGTFGQYGADAAVVLTQPLDDVVFAPTEPAGPYSWELFFHVALAAGTALSRNQRFADARSWFHRIFDPTDTGPGPVPGRYWRFRPFREIDAGPPMPELLRRLADKDDHSPEKMALLATIAEWRERPFEPHVVARLRPRAYMYAVVMKYLDNLIAWGDQLFRRETMEALDEATQLYVLAAQILGRRPETIPPRTRPLAKSYGDLRPELVGDAGTLGNPLVVGENILGSGGTTSPATGALPRTLYFCVPGNPKLLGYHATVADRLNKLRNCMTIDGVVRQLPLFEPPIDPGLLVRARASGVDLGSVLADANAPLPLYRFATMSRTAAELCGHVRELGSQMLSAIEKRDGEVMSRLRDGHERTLLASVRQVRQLQVDEALASLQSYQPVLTSAQERLAYYAGLVTQVGEVSIPGGPAGPTIESIAGAAIETVTNTLGFTQSLISQIDPFSSAATELVKQALTRATELIQGGVPEAGEATAKVPINDAEKRQLTELRQARDSQARAADMKAAARFLAMIPDITLGSSGATGSPVVTAQLGGTLLAKAAELFAAQADGAAAEHSYRASVAAILAGHQRRAADWVEQAKAAANDITQATHQIAAAGTRVAIASAELRNHDLQAEQADEVDELMRSRFSNQELYAWMMQQVGDAHFRSYQLAYDVAKRAEQAYRHELGVDSTSFIRFGYWDSVRRGLSAGDHLLHDLKRMEVSYLNEDRRELEVVKHVSLRQLDGAALLRLRATGTCEFDVPESLLDLDFPGHYFRRLRDVAVSVPSVAGPYTGVNGTLTLLSSVVRNRPVASGDYDAPENLAISRVPIQSVVTHSGQEDNGRFDGTRPDDRYGPFEGAGALSRWRFTMPDEFRAFDYSTISDLVLHLRFTARDGGETLATKARRSLAERLGAQVRARSTEVGLVQLLPLELDFPREWRRFRDDHEPLLLTVTEQHFPYMFRGRVAPHAAALVWDGESPGISVDPLQGNDDALPTYTLSYDAKSPLLTTSDPHLLVAYSV